MAAVSAGDVAAFIFHERGQRYRGWKLQKLLYYAQAWSLVWDEHALFDDPIEAWKDGPVVRSVYTPETHSDAGVQGDRTRLSHEQAETVREVLRAYAGHDGEWLSHLTHRERPWLDAQQSAGVSKGSSSRETISPDAMRAYYSAAKQPRKAFSDAYLRGLKLLVSLPEDEAESLFEEGQSVSGEDAIAWLEGTGPDPWVEQSV